jgi:rhomboid protease GluP
MTARGETTFPIDDESWVTVRRFSSLDDAYDHGLVVLAMGEECRVEEESGAFILQTEEAPTEFLESELSAYSEEAAALRNKAPVPQTKFFAPGWGWYAVWVLLMVMAYEWQGRADADVDRYVSSSIGLIGHGEWWRPFTALFLHADLPHLTGNLLVGLGFTVFVSRMFGAALAWSLILCCGALGNAVNCLLHYPDSFESLGASTAVFAALGLLSGGGMAESWHMRPHWTWPKIIAPFLAGVVLLGMLGVSADPLTDVLGHVCGFAVGVVAGIIAGYGISRPADKSVTS